MVTVKVFGNLKTILRKSEVRLDTGGEDRTITDVLNRLTKQSGKGFRQELYDPEGRVKASYSVYVNGRNIGVLSGLNTKLKNDDIVSVLPIVEGG